MKYFVAIVCLLLAACQAHAQTRPETTPGGWGEFAMGYYKHPEPQRVSEIMAALARSEHPLGESQALNVTMFFSYVFAANPEMKPEWEKQIASLGGQTQQLMLLAIHTPPETLLARIPPSPFRNDALWNCFFATGDQQCVNELITYLGYMGYPSSERDFAIGWTAKWSLASNMLSNPLVREAIVNAAKSGSPEVRMQSQSILKLSFVDIRLLGSLIMRTVLQGSDVPYSVWMQGNHLTEHVVAEGGAYRLRFEIWAYGPRDLRIAIYDESKEGGAKQVSGTMLLIDGRFLATQGIELTSGQPIDAIDVPILSRPCKTSTTRMNAGFAG